MPRSLIPLVINDLSGFTKALAKSLAQHQALSAAQPPHLKLMNLLAQAAGHQNLQSLKAQAARKPPAADSSRAEAIAAPPSLTPLARKTLAQLDGTGRLTRLPNKLSVQKMAVWCLWTRFSARRRYTEREVNDVLKAYNTFGDHATLRRELVETKLLQRTADCAEYRKCTAKPSDEVAAMLAAYHAATKRVAQSDATLADVAMTLADIR